MTTNRALIILIGLLALVLLVRATMERPQWVIMPTPLMFIHKVWLLPAQDESIQLNGAYIQKHKVFEPDTMPPKPRR